ncbi:MAG: hypothetical protein JSW55_17095 [Chloroflexota bacterium]|nr:MAG: hypothetical protein JSW55_17095 [Chloroflexota bacterium]
MKLILLRCPNCAQPMTPENDDVVFMCTNCFTSVSLDEGGLQSVDVRFALPPKGDPRAEQWLPFWVYEGQVQILKRDTQGRSDGKASAQQWARPLRMYVPAWEMSMQVAQEVGSRLIERQPATKSIERPPTAYLAPAVVTPEEALGLLEFIVLAIEARRRDWLKALDFRIEAGQPELWAMPKGSF